MDLKGPVAIALSILFCLFSISFSSLFYSNECWSRKNSNRTHNTWRKRGHLEFGPIKNGQLDGPHGTIQVLFEPFPSIWGFSEEKTDGTHKLRHAIHVVREIIQSARCISDFFPVFQCHRYRLAAGAMLTILWSHDYIFYSKPSTVPLERLYIPYLTRCVGALDGSVSRERGFFLLSHGIDVYDEAFVSPSLLFLFLVLLFFISHLSCLPFHFGNASQLFSLAASYPTHLGGGVHV